MVEGNQKTYYTWIDIIKYSLTISFIYTQQIYVVLYDVFNYFMENNHNSRNKDRIPK